MSIYVSITRHSDPLDDEGPAITSDEWIKLIEGERDFRESRASETSWLGPFARWWTGHSEYPVAFDWRRGVIDVKNPDPATIVRMKGLAAKLHATVFSETGEIYDERGEPAGFLEGFP